MPRNASRRRVCFVTGTRAEFGLMESTLRALRDHPAIELQLIATGTHTQKSRGDTLAAMRRDGWKVDAVVPWADDTSPGGIARATGKAMASLAGRFAALQPDIVLVVGDRVEAFAAASAAQIGGQVLAHVHGGDRALGQVDDSLRHAISKLAQVHFAATKQSGARLFALGEDKRRIHVVGAPGVDGIRDDADGRASMSEFGKNLGIAGLLCDYVLLLLHPTDADDAAEARRVSVLMNAATKIFGGKIIALRPNSDPGSAGIERELVRRAMKGECHLVTHVDRPAFLGLMRECRALIGNSSSGIIEAGSFGTPVLDIGPRQQGRERGSNVRNVGWNRAAIVRALRKIANAKRSISADNPYEAGRGGAGKRIASILASITIDDQLRRKMIRY